MAIEIADERQRLIDLFTGLRVTDVCDAMDAVGLQDIGVMDQQIRPLWRDLEQLHHRLYGFAHTVRLKPATQRAPQFADYDAFKQWMGKWYREMAKGPIIEEIEGGDVIVIDAAGVGDCGFIGSCNSLHWVSKGALGMVTNGGARDTDEIMRQKTPVYCAKIGRGIRPGRLELADTLKPITCGGVDVRRGDFVVADGDGVIVVPIEKAEQVAHIAIDVQEGDKKGRRWFHNELGMTGDFTTEARPQDGNPG